MGPFTGTRFYVAARRPAGVRITPSPRRHRPRRVTARPRAAIVATGSELVRGERTDRNGPFLAAEALRHGLEPARITIVGDNPVELEAALRDGLEADACFVSGGLGPTHDDRTVEMIARAAGLELVVDEELEEQIGAVSRAVAERLRRPYADFAAGVRKQATRPVPAVSIGLAGTAPGLVFRAPNGCVVVVLPGPPAELQRLWPNALASEPVRELLARTTPPDRRVLRLFGLSESAVARALDEAGGDGDGVEVTICAREFEIYVDFVVEPGADERADSPRGRDGRAAREVDLLPRRALGRGTRPRARAGARPDDRDGGVVHRRPRRRAADARAGLERELRRRRSSPMPTP